MTSYLIILALLIFPLLVKKLVRSERVVVQWPLILIKGKKGIDLMKKLSKKRDFWIRFSEFGLILSYGLIGYFLFKKNFRKRPHYYFPALFAISLCLFGPLGMFLSALGGFALFGFYFMCFHAVKILKGETTQAGLIIGIPGITLPLSTIAILALLVFVHEFAHGILALTEKVAVKSSGLLLLGFVPIGGFVEPDEIQIRKGKEDRNIRIFSAGSTANFFLAFIFFLLFTSLSFLFLDSIVKGVKVVEVEEGMPSFGILKEGDTIISVNGVRIRRLKDLERAKRLEMNTWIIETQRGVFSIKHKDGRIGVLLKEDIKEDLLSQTLAFLIFQSYWGFVLNMAIGIPNILPLLPFDGGRMVQEFVKMKVKGNKKKKERISRQVSFLLSFFTLLLFLINLLPSLT